MELDRAFVLNTHIRTRIHHFQPCSRRLLFSRCCLFRRYRFFFILTRSFSKQKHTHQICFAHPCDSSNPPALVYIYHFLFIYSFAAVMLPRNVRFSSASAWMCQFRFIFIENGFQPLSIDGERKLRKMKTKTKTQYAAYLSYPLSMEFHARITESRCR